MIWLVVSTSPPEQLIHYGYHPFFPSEKNEMKYHRAPVEMTRVPPNRTWQKPLTQELPHDAIGP